MIGTSIGTYRITAKLGAGGMGEVYRATDTKLKRDVALKVLPEAFARDPERLARFEREAEVLASLNHPNIASIYGVVEDRALVMELVEGSEPKGPLSFDEAWAIMSQVAAALDYAHEKGVVHRDLKPANIKVEPDGRVKLLDFGLAKAFNNQPDTAANPENSPTLTIGATQAGVILGTAAYMSPEQAKGKSVDKRADIWAFGVLLYELLTGERLFKGEDIGEVLASVIKDKPNLSSAPPEFRRLLAACLEKDPKQRLQAAGDYRLLLGVTESIPSAKRNWIWPAIAAVLFLAGVAASYWLRPIPTEPVRKLTILPPEGTSLVDVAVSGMSLISPDGRTLAFVAEKSGQRMLWVRPLDSLEPRPLPGTEGAMQPFWSPDSHSLGFSAQGKLKRIDVAGGPAQALSDVSTTAGGSASSAWSLQGKILFSTSSNSNLFLVSAVGGERTEATKLDSKRGETSHLHPEFLPDGRHYLYHVRAAGTTEFQIYVGVLGSNERMLLLRGVTEVRYAPPRAGRSGYLLYAREGTLMAQPFDADRRALTGDAVAVAEQVATSTGGVAADFSVSTNGVLAYRRSGSASRDQELAWFDRTGKQIASVLKRPDAMTVPRLSPDGKRAIFQLGRQGTGSSQETWLVDLDRNVTSRFTFNGGLNPVWSPDGAQIVFSRWGDGLYARASNGAGADKALWKDQARLFSIDWSRDGRFLLIDRQDPNTGRDLWLLPIFADTALGGKPIPLLQTPADEQSGRFLPGPGAPKWLAYSSNASGTNEVYVMAMPGQLQGKWQVSNGGGQSPRWRIDGRELYYLALDNRSIMAVDIDAGQSFRAGTPHPLFKEDRLGGFDSWDTSADGKRFLVTLREIATSAPSINVILNWQGVLPK